MWVNYANQSIGCIMLFDNDFFKLEKNDKYIHTKYSYIMDKASKNSDSKNQDKTEKRNRDLSYIELYKVIYLEKDEDNKYYIIKETEENKKIKETNDKVKEFKEIYKNFKKLYKSLKESKKLTEEQINIINEILYDIIQYTSFIFKAKHFEYEQEVRIIKRIEMDDSRIKLDEKAIPELYVKLDRDIKCKEVILGAKCENKKAMSAFLYSKGVEKVTKSKLKYK